MLNCLMWPNNIAALAWLPWLVWAGERAWREGGRWLLWAALVGSLQMLSGAPEVILLTWVLLAALLAGQMTLNSKERWWMARRFAFLVLWVAGLAAAQHGRRFRADAIEINCRMTRWIYAAEESIWLFNQKRDISACRAPSSQRHQEQGDKPQTAAGPVAGSR